MSTWIPLLVPAEDYQELAELVAARVASRADVPSIAATDLPTISSTAASGTDPVIAEAFAAFQPWTVSDLRRLASSSVVTAQRWTRAIDVCCRHVGDVISTMQVAEESGMGLNEWRDAPRKFPRHLAAHYPSVPGWPLVAISGKRLGHSYDQVYWGVTEEQATHWAEARRVTE